MRQFRFRLQKILDLYKHTEHQWEIKLALITGECLSIENKINDVRDLIINGAGIRVDSEKGLDVNSLVYRQLYVNRLISQQRKLETELIEKKKKRQEVMEEYLVHSRKRKVLDKLKERQSKIYFKTQFENEFKATDDQNNSAYHRKQLGL